MWAQQEQVEEQFEASLPHARQALLLDPGNLQAQLLLLNAALQLGHDEEAARLDHGRRRQRPAREVGRGVGQVEALSLIHI